MLDIFDIIKTFNHNDMKWNKSMIILILYLLVKITPYIYTLYTVSNTIIFAIRKYYYIIAAIFIYAFYRYRYTKQEIKDIYNIDEL